MRDEDINAQMDETAERVADEINQDQKPVKTDIPLPPYAGSYGTYRGRAFAFKTTKGGVAATPLHSPLHVLSGLTYPDRLVHGRQARRGVLVEFDNGSGKTIKLPFKRSDALLSTRSGMIPDLADAGVSFTAAGIEEFMNSVLSGGENGDGAIVYDYPGWRDDDIFVTPGGELVGKSNFEIGLAAPLPGIGQCGTMGGWKEAAAWAFNDEMVEKAPHVATAVLFAFVSPLIDRAHEEMSLILSIAKRTTGLKTFALRAKASVWGDIKETRGVLVTFSSTPNKLEEYAIGRSGCGLAVDETTLIEGDKLPGFLYRIATGAERGRKNEVARHWRIACTITSETPIQQLIRASGVEPPPGLMSRVVEVAGTGERVSDEPVNGMRTIADPAHLQHYGHAGPAFVRAMLDRGYSREKIVSEVADRVRTLLGGIGGREQERRASRAIAYIGLAGTIAKEAGLIPDNFNVEAFTAALWEAAKGASDTTSPVMARVCEALSKGLRTGEIPIYSDNGDALSTGDSGAVCVQQFTKQKMPVFVLPTSTLAKLIGARESVRDAAKMLDAAGFLLREQEDRQYWRPGRARVGNVSSYVLYARAVLGDDAEDMIEEHRKARLASVPLSRPQGGDGPPDRDRKK